MNIAILPSAYYPSLGGVEELTRQLALELHRQGHGVVLVTNRWPRDLPEREMVDGITLYRLPMRFPIASMKSQLSYLTTRGLIRSRLVQILRQHRTEVLHVQCVSAQGYYALGASRDLGLPLVVTLQGELTMDATQVFHRSARSAELLKRLVVQSDRLTGCSRKTLDDALAFTGVSRSAGTAVVFNGARVEDFRLAVPVVRERPYVFALGRMVPQKGFDVLLDVVGDALPEGWQLVLAGDGPDLDSLKGQASRLGLGDKVVFFGRADRKSVPALMAGCQFVVVPSRADEGLPVVCAETMAAGKPIVATTKGGIPEAVVPGETGLLVPAEDRSALKGAIVTLASDASMRERMSSAATARSALFEWPYIARQYVEVYGQAMASRQGANSSATSSVASSAT